MEALSDGGVERDDHNGHANTVRIKPLLLVAGYISYPFLFVRLQRNLAAVLLIIDILDAAVELALGASDTRIEV
jgi:hypothetical protein